MGASVPGYTRRSSPGTSCHPQPIPGSQAGSGSVQGRAALGLLLWPTRAGGSTGEPQTPRGCARPSPRAGAAPNLCCQPGGQGDEFPLGFPTPRAVQRHEAQSRPWSILPPLSFPAPLHPPHVAAQPPRPQPQTKPSHSRAAQMRGRQNPRKDERDPLADPITPRCALLPCTRSSIFPMLGGSDPPCTPGQSNARNVPGKGGGEVGDGQTFAYRLLKGISLMQELCRRDQSFRDTPSLDWGCGLCPFSCGMPYGCQPMVPVAGMDPDSPGAAQGPTEPRPGCQDQRQRITGKKPGEIHFLPLSSTLTLHHPK